MSASLTDNKVAVDCREQSSLLAMFRTQAGRHANRPLTYAKTDGHWASLTWQQVEQTVNKIANGLIAQGLKPGDRVVLLSENRPEWLIADLAVMSAGGITTPAYTTHSVHDLAHILEDSGAGIAITSTKELADKLVTAARKSEHCQTLITIEPHHFKQSPGMDVLNWSTLVAADAPATPPQTESTLSRKSTACIIYTSGTGGAPKGVMISHGSVLHNCHGAYMVIKDLHITDETFLSFLPLSHAYEHSAGQFFPLSIGAKIYYAEGLEYLANNLTEARPTIMTAVPRLYEVLRQKILAGVDRKGGLSAKLFHRTLELGRKAYLTPREMTIIERLQNAVLSLLVRRKVAKRFGGQLKVLVSGGAPLNLDVGLFFTALGIRILQGYGQTETGPVISVNRAFKVKMDTVGPPLADTELKIAEDGEILIRGELCMQGYWNNPRATAEVIDAEGWVHTGDIGELDEDGYLKITDRKKDIIVNSGGDNLSPQRVEGMLTLAPEIAQAMVYGDKRPYLVALIVPDADFAKKWAAQNNVDTDADSLLDDLCYNKDFKVAIEKAVRVTNENLSNIEKVRRFMLADQTFNIENAMLTPTLKIRRHAILAKWRNALENLYEGKQKKQ